MIHSLSGGVISDDEQLTYVFVRTQDGRKRWYICPFFGVSEGSRVMVTMDGESLAAEVTRVEYVTKKTAPWPVNRTAQVEALVDDDGGLKLDK